MCDKEKLVHNLCDINKEIVDFSKQFSKFRECNVISKDVCINLHRLVREIYEYLDDDNLMDFVIECSNTIPNSDNENDGQVTVPRRRRIRHGSNLICEVCPANIEQHIYGDHICEQQRIEFNKTKESDDEDDYNSTVRDVENENDENKQSQSDKNEERSSDMKREQETSDSDDDEFVSEYGDEDEEYQRSEQNQRTDDDDEDDDDDDNFKSEDSSDEYQKSEQSQRTNCTREDEESDYDEKRFLDNIIKQKSSRNEIVINNIDKFVKKNFQQKHDKFLAEQFIVAKHVSLGMWCTLCKCYILQADQQVHSQTKKHLSNISSSQMLNKNFNFANIFEEQYMLNYYCNLCKMQLRDNFHVEDNLRHIMSETHQNNINLLKYVSHLELSNKRSHYAVEEFLKSQRISESQLNKVNGIYEKYNCKICNITAHDKDSISSHLRGSKHQFALTKLKSSSNENNRKDVVHISFKCLKCKFLSETKEGIFSHISCAFHIDKLSVGNKFSLITAEQIEQLLKYDKIFKENYITTITEKYGFCRICRLLVPGVKSIIQHKNGRYHAKMLKKQNSNKLFEDKRIVDDPNLILLHTNFCKICKKRVSSSSERLHKHITNKKHIENLKKYNSKHLPESHGSMWPVSASKIESSQYSDVPKPSHCDETKSEESHQSTSTSDDDGAQCDSDNESLSNIIQNVETLKLMVSKQTEEKLKTNHIITKEKLSFYCELCKKSFSKFSIHHYSRKHDRKLVELKDTPAVKNNKYYFEFTEEYYCNLCKQSLGVREKKVIKHIKKPNHKKNLKSLSKCHRSIVEINFIKVVQNKENLKLFLNNKILHSNKLKDLVEYKAIIAVLENSLNRIFPPTKIYLFGPRLFGLGCFHPTQDIFIDTGFNYLQWPIDSNVLIQNKIQQIIHHLKQNFHSSWSNLGIVFNNEPELYGKFADHTCDYRMTFTNGMDHARTTLLHYYFQQQPICQTLCTFLIQITIESHLDKILNTDIVCSLVVFYLQLHKYLPPVKQLLVLNKPPIARIGPWQINYITCTTNTKFHDIFPKITDERRIFEIMKDFLVFYSNLFDYNNVIMSPFLGQVLQRSDFEKSVPTILPELYDYYIRCPFKIKLNIDSALCIQDFIELNSNVGQKVKQEDLNRFIDCLREILLYIKW